MTAAYQIGDKARSATLKTLQHRNTPFTWGVLVICFLFFVPSLLVDRIWINVESVEVNQTNVLGEPIELKVNRKVLQEFKGYFTVDIRRVDGELVYQASSNGAFSYSPGKQLPNPLLMNWWVGGEHELENARKRGFNIGFFYLDTCHTVVIGVWDIPFARRCVQSNVFQVINNEGNT